MGDIYHRIVKEQEPTDGTVLVTAMTCANNVSRHLFTATESVKESIERYRVLANQKLWR